MDRCRCEDYAAAVKKLKFFTVGTLRPDIFESFMKTREKYITADVPNRISLVDRRFMKSKAWKKRPGDQTQEQSNRARLVDGMWSPYRTPFQLEMFETSEDAKKS